jgi:polar amino acid transport system substrate-binding protein
MNRRRLLAAAVCLLAAALGWLFWPGQDTPLSQFLRRDVTWQAMQSRGAWRVGMDPSFPPFESLDADNLPAGYDVELAKALAAEWGLQAEIVPIGFDSLLDALRASKIDAIISAYPYDARLTRDVAFSQAYFDAGLQLAVREGSPVRGVDDLAGKRVAVEWGSEGDMIGRQLQRDGLTLELVPFETPQDAVAALVEGSKVDALLVDGVTLRQAQASGAPLAAAGPYLTSNPYVIVVPRRATELLERTDAGLTALRNNGVLGRLEKEWFGG